MKTKVNEIAPFRGDEPRNGAGSYLICLWAVRSASSGLLGACQKSNWRDSIRRHI